MISLALYLIALFFIGVGSAIATYHVLRYRDPHDASGVVLVVYYLVAFVVLVGTAFMINWSELLASTPVVFGN